MERQPQARAGQVEIVDVPPRPFLMADGTGDPNTSPESREAVEALYTLRSLLRKRGVNEKVGPLEGLWWADDMMQFSVDRKGNWNWTMMIALPEAATLKEVEAAWAAAAHRKPLPRVRLEMYDEGLCAQVLHIGPYSAEGSAIERLHAFISERGGTLTGTHHEIYLGDPNRAAPEKLRTIIRRPFTRGGTV
ncbi:GyrI-like domain-containing protein [Deinococcus planocerae]|uniref:GyrI-like domain-containing protein n=1 Tax=Deinococcus planocerae TaxID=1737569 RepID=UPI000C7ECEC9|nr:GyrI-like domain-containing protein [Deinococcus planocerae]